MTKNDKPLVDSFLCPSPLITPLPVFYSKSWRNWRFSTSSPADTGYWSGLMMHPVEQLCFVPWKRRANIDMSDFPGPLSHNLRSPLDENQGKYTPFGGESGCLTTVLGPWKASGHDQSSPHIQSRLMKGITAIVLPDAIHQVDLSFARRVLNRTRVSRSAGIGTCHRSIYCT